MKQENIYYEVTPRILRADRKATVRIRPLFDHCRFDDKAEYVVAYYPSEEFALRSGWPAKARMTLKPTRGVLRVPLYFEGEQEHVLLVERVAGEQRKQLGEFRLYSLEADLFARRPYKGDFHIHSCCSDGVESPAYVAGACRRIGMDFMAVTDHRRYAPSLEAQRAYSRLSVDLRIYPGEEVHPPDNPVHIVNFGGGFSLSEFFARKEKTYRREVKAIQQRLGPLPAGVDPYQYASCLWCFDRIREAGGLGVFCHPYWFTDRRYTPSGALTTHLFATQPYDAFELIGGYELHAVDSNTLQVARYHDERAAGRRIPIVGASDAHGCEAAQFFGWYYTVVFSPSTDLPDIIESVKGLHSVAVEVLPGAAARAYGPFRLVKYALFLLREVFPQHDELCREEGRLMLAHLAGDRGAADMLSRLKGRAGTLLECFRADKR
jgi:hypothetical protein